MLDTPKHANVFPPDTALKPETGTYPYYNFAKVSGIIDAEGWETIALTVKYTPKAAGVKPIIKLQMRLPKDPQGDQDQWFDLMLEEQTQDGEILWPGFWSTPVAVSQDEVDAGKFFAGLLTCDNLRHCHEIRVCAGERNENGEETWTPGLVWINYRMTREK